MGLNKTKLTPYHICQKQVSIYGQANEAKLFSFKSQLT